MTKGVSFEPCKRKGFWYLIRRVPKAFESVDARRIVFLSTGIPVPDDPRGVRARKRVALLNDELEMQWLAKRDKTLA